MHIPVTERIALTEYRTSDRAACLERLNDREISQRMMTTPFPYTDTNFDEWLETVRETTAQYGEPVHLAIREDDSLIGGLGFKELAKGHKTEIGYWLGRNYWGRGIMTAVVESACEYAFEQWQLVRIFADAASDNAASARVLEKNGFQFEGLLRKHRCKEGQFLDSKLLALVR